MTSTNQPDDGIVVVTGASRGIGRAIAERLSASGRTVVGTFNTGRDEANDLSASHGVEVIHVDLGDRDSTGTLIEALAGRPIAGLVNNAGIIEFETFDEFTMDAWDRTFEVNVNAPLLLAKELSPAMRAGAAIVNVASTDAHVGSYSSIAYSASKAALISLTQSLACVLGGAGIRVVAVTPGWIDTGMSTDESYEAASLTPLGRNGLPDEVASLVEYLLGAGGSFITGSSLVIDGGYTCVDYIMKKENDALAAAD